MQKISSGGLSLKNKKVGIIGAGNMGQAMIKGWLESKALSPSQISVTNRSPGKLEKLKKLYDIQVVSSNEQLVEENDIIILAVKPQDIQETIEQFSNSMFANTILISLVAGVDLQALRKYFPEGSLHRVMMNTPIHIQKGVIGFCSSDSVYEALLHDLFSPLGLTMLMEEGDPFEAFTVASSSGTGFIFELMSYWQEWIEEHGVDQEVARAIVTQTFLGTAQLAEQSTENFEDLQNRVVSKKGMTAAGLESMRTLEIEGLMRMSFNKAALRFRELGLKAP